MVGVGRELCLVISAVSIAVLSVKMVIPMKIHTMEKRRAAADLGTLSPYPTVVTDMKLHQKPGEMLLHEIFNYIGGPNQPFLTLVIDLVIFTISNLGNKDEFFGFTFILHALSTYRCQILSHSTHSGRSFWTSAIYCKNQS